MPAVEDTLAELVAHPPVEPTPVGEIRGRARRRTRRRRVVVGAAATLVLVALGVGLGAAVTTDDPGEDVVADGRTTTEDPPTSTTPQTSAPVTVTVPGDPPPPAEPQVAVDGDEGTVGDGDTILVTVTGVETDEVIVVQQCRPGGGCDAVRARRVSVQDGPETQLTVTAFHDVYVDTDPGDAYRPGWAACEPCELQVLVGARTEASARLPLVMEPTDAPVRPQVTLDPAGPHAWGEEVTVRATGLQPASDVSVGWCPTVPPQGGGGSACWSGQAESPGRYRVAVDGTLVIERFVLPSPDSFVGTDCAVAGACGVGIDGGDSASVVAIAPLDLGG